MLFALADKLERTNYTYSEITCAILGKKYKNIVDLLLIVLQIGCCVSYVIFFLDFFEQVFEASGKKSADIIYLLLAMTIIMPLSMLDNIKLFAKYSFIGNVLILLTLLVVTIKNFDVLYTTNNYKENHTN